MDERELALKLASKLADGAVRVDEPMSEHTTFRIGGPAHVFVEPSSAEEAQAVVRACLEAGVAYRVLGCGSDLLVSDAGVAGVTIHLGPRFSRVSVEGRCVRAQAGATNEDVSRAAQAAGLAGYEFASGIPGSVGGAAIMNAGAYDGEFRDVCTELLCLDERGGFVQVSADAAQWGYRKSMMSEQGYVVLEVQLELEPDDPQAVRARVEDLAQRRASKQPLELPSAGSTFKRPEGHFAGKLVQDAGLRGVRVGGAQVSEKHTGFVVNAGGATAADVRDLIALVQDRVWETQGVRLEPEVRFWGFDE